MRVCHITTVHKPFDGRIFHKECKSLASAGYEVFLVAPHPRDEEVEGIRIRAIRRISDPYRRILVAPWIAFRRALKTGATVFHIHDPELLIAGFFVSLSGKKVIFDSHEYVSRQIMSKDWIPTKFLRKVSSLSYKLFERLSTLFYAGIVTADKDIARSFSHKRNVAAVHNYPILAYIFDNTYQQVEKNDENVMIYAGGLTRIRGIKEMVMAMKDINARLWLMGPWDSASYRAECESIPSWSKCDYLGELPFGRQYDYFRAADIGMATLYPEKNYLHSMPVKAFEYMACGQAIIMSDFDFWMETYADFALFVDPFSPDDIAAKANMLINDKSLLRKMQKAGIEKVKAKYSWEKEQENLISLYNKITRHNKLNKE